MVTCLRLSARARTGGRADAAAANALALPRGNNRSRSAVVQPVRRRHREHRIDDKVLLVIENDPHFVSFLVEPVRTRTTSRRCRPRAGRRPCTSRAQRRPERDHPGHQPAGHRRLAHPQPPEGRRRDAAHPRAGHHHRRGGPRRAPSHGRDRRADASRCATKQLLDGSVPGSAVAGFIGAAHPAACCCSRGRRQNGQDDGRPDRRAQGLRGRAGGFRRRRSANPGVWTAGEGPQSSNLLITSVDVP
jgi:hypothetical protein